MNVLFLMFTFPDMNKSFNMYTAMVGHFHADGHQVTVLAPKPGAKKTEICIEKRIEVLRVKTLPLKNVSNIRKGISNILLPYQYEKELKRFYKGKTFDLIIIPTPPISLGSLAERLKRKHKAKLYLILRDIFPQNAVDLGFMNKRSPIFTYFRKKERRLYQVADSIGCMSHGNIEYTLKHNPGLKRENLHILRNWQYPYTSFGNNPEQLASKYQLEGKFVVIFGGNMGKPQQLENVLELAKRCLVLPDVLFLLLGEGVHIERLRHAVAEQKITNIRITSSVPKQEYQDLLRLCAVGLISLNQNFIIPNIPSKILDYLNVGIPVLAAIDKNTDFGKDMEEAGCGYHSHSGDHEQFFANFLKLYNNPELRVQMGANGKNYFNKYLTDQVAYETILQNIQ